MKTLRKEMFYDRAPHEVWTALTDPQALAEWLMPNNFQPVVGRKFQFHVDPMPGFSGVTNCEVLEVDAPSRLVYTWQPVPKKPGQVPPVPMTLVWTLVPTGSGTTLILEQTGVEALSFWHRLSMQIGWSRMLKKFLPQVLGHVDGSTFQPGAITRRDYGTKTVPEGFAK